MANDMIYKHNGQFHFSDYVEQYIVQSASELSDIATSNHAQMCLVIGSGNNSAMYARLPSGNWTQIKGA